MSDRRLDALEGLFKALGDRTRLRILGLLAHGEVCVCDIHGALDIPQPTASRHLAYLRRAGLVATRRDGLWVHYRLADLSDPVLQAVLDAAAHAVAHAEVTGRDTRRLGRRIPLTAAPQLPDRGQCC
jgi:ArsR family transcriptional regulator